MRAGKRPLAPWNGHGCGADGDLRGMVHLFALPGELFGAAVLGAKVVPELSRELDLGEGRGAFQLRLDDVPDCGEVDGANVGEGGRCLRWEIRFGECPPGGSLLIVNVDAAHANDEAHRGE